MQKRIERFDKGLFLSCPIDQLPDGYLRRCRGLHPLSTASFRSRSGSSLFSSLNAHSIFKFSDHYIYGVLSTPSSYDLYFDETQVTTGLNSTRLHGTTMASVAGGPDYLFLTDKTDLFKLDTAGTLTDWGFDSPATAPTLTAISGGEQGISTAVYKWTRSGSGTAEYYVTLLSGADPAFGSEPIQVREGSYGTPPRTMTKDTAGSLAKGEWAWGDNDTLGFSTIYVRLSTYGVCAGDVDPDGELSEWVKYTLIPGYLEDATYQYNITYLNSTSGHRSNPYSTAQSITLTNQNVTISDIPDGSLIDPQIDKIEIWRTVENGSILFYLTSLTIGTTSFTDDGTISISSIELPTDNLKPFSYFTDCLGPHNASMFWITSDETNERGRVYYSPIGRAESLEGFIEICADSTPLQRLFSIQGQLGVIGTDGIYLIGGGNPYLSRPVPGCPGTIYPDTVVTTPVGLIYQSYDGIRLFDGNTSSIISPGAIDILALGESVGDLSSFKGIIATFGLDQYFITDRTTTLSFNISTKVWRDLGIGLFSLFYDRELNSILSTIDSLNTVVRLEQPNQTLDSTLPIDLSIEPQSFNLPDSILRILFSITFDIDTNSNSIDIYLTTDGIESLLGSISNSSRSKITIFPSTIGHHFSIRLSSSLLRPIELFSITYNVEDFITFQDSSSHLLQFITLDISTSTSSPSLIANIDSVNYDLGTINSPNRSRITIPVGISGSKFGFFFEPTVEQGITVYSIIPEFK